MQHQLGRVLHRPELFPVDTFTLFRYPIPVGTRLSSHDCLLYRYGRWRGSDFRRDADDGAPSSAAVGLAALHLL